MKIKFRGIAEDGKNIFSDSIQFDVDSKGREFCRLKDEFGNWLFVDPDSIAQFVGYDADGKEVYEGDILIEYKKPYVECLPEEIEKFECKIRLITRITLVDTNGGGYELDDKRRVFKLKGRGENEKNST